MRTLRRNQSKFSYANITGRERITGTGEYRNLYSYPKTAWANISSATGEKSTEIFGDLTDYDKIMVFSDLPISEATRLWVDESDVTKPSDYAVKRVSKGLNDVTVAIKKDSTVVTFEGN